MRAVGLALLATVLLAAPAQGAETKYSIANGCFEVARGAPAGPYRMKATALAQYLLYTQDEKFLDAGAGRPTSRARRPSGARPKPGGAIELEPLDGGDKLTLGKPPRGCAEYPEIELNVSGKPLSRPLPSVRSAA